jgi:uncharacterized protein YegP (UPF0339 family)
MPYFTIDPAKGGYRSHFWGDNHRLVWWTQTYDEKVDAARAIAMLKRHTATAPVRDRAKAA